MSNGKRHALITEVHFFKKWLHILKYKKEEIVLASNEQHAYVGLESGSVRPWRYFMSETGRILQNGHAIQWMCVFVLLIITCYSLLN